MKLTSLLLCSLFAAGAVLTGSLASTSKLVHIGKDGKLIYETYTDRGDRIPDFSNCGYMGGGVELPKVDVKATVEPVDGDDMANIQAAVDKVGEMPLGKDGFRGAVLIKKGKYEISGTLKLSVSGVVIRGEGQGEDGTVLLSTAKGKATLISVGGEGKPVEVKDSRTAIADEYVPVGARSFRVDSAKGYKVGQNIIVFRPSTTEWLHELGMDKIRNSNSTTVQWAAGSKALDFQRVITAVKGNEITIDAPIVNAIQKEYGGGYIYRYDFPGRVSKIGVENLRGDSVFDASQKKGSAFIDENHSWNFISMSSVENAWVSAVTSIHFAYACVSITKNAKWVSIERCECLEPVSQVTGGRRYSFAVGGQLCLVKDCFSRHGRHDFVLQATVPGPNAFVNCTAKDSYCTSEPHHRWSAGALWDNVSIAGNGYLQAINRGNSGTGHGWSGAQMVFWNCKAPVIVGQKPPTAQNFIIGCGTTFTENGVARGAVDWANSQSGSKIKLDSTCVGDCYIESPDALVEPSSLYEKQLQDRMGKSLKKD